MEEVCKVANCTHEEELSSLDDAHVCRASRFLVLRYFSQMNIIIQMRTKEDIFAILAAMYDLCSVIKPTKDPGS